jgi:hypothetical protein
MSRAVPARTTADADSLGGRSIVVGSSRFGIPRESRRLQREHATVRVCGSGSAPVGGVRLADPLPAAPMYPSSRAALSGAWYFRPFCSVVCARMNAPIALPPNGFCIITIDLGKRGQAGAGQSGPRGGSRLLYRSLLARLAVHTPA